MNTLAIAAGPNYGALRTEDSIGSFFGRFLGTEEFALNKKNWADCTDSEKYAKVGHAVEEFLMDLVPYRKSVAAWNKGSYTAAIAWAAFDTLTLFWAPAFGLAAKAFYKPLATTGLTTASGTLLKGTIGTPLTTIGKMAGSRVRSLVGNVVEMNKSLGQGYAKALAEAGETAARAPAPTLGASIANGLGSIWKVLNPVRDFKGALGGSWQGRGVTMLRSAAYDTFGEDAGVLVTNEIVEQTVTGPAAAAAKRRSTEIERDISTLNF